MSNRVIPIAIIAVVVIGAGLGYLFFLRPSQPELPNGGEEPPNGDMEIVFTTTDGDELTIDDLLADEKPLIIYFFATWCPTCRKDLENLNATHPQYKEEISVLVVGFDRTESLDKIRDYKEGRNYEWPFAAYNSDAVTEFQVVSQASKVGISLEGEVVFTRGYGVMSGDGWKDLFQELT
jgi:thiol-disulfide isomerase/thioredoxin